MYEIIRNSQKVIKTFVFQKQKTHQSVIIDREIDFKQTYVNLNHLFLAYCPLQTNKVSIYDQSTNQFITLRQIGGEHGYIARHYLEPNFILLRYHERLQNQDDEQNNQSSYSEGEKQRRDPRSKQRTVSEVIQLVKKWRELHLHCFKTPENKKKVNLQEAAKMIGVAKKSLDDYYCQLRLAQLYRFDFKNNLQQKMGVLRAFVKQNRSLKQYNLSKYYKHPKKLKIIEQFQVQNNNFQNSQKIIDQIKPDKPQDRNQAQQEILEQDDKESIEQSRPTCKQLCNLENEFYKGFQFLLDGPHDPFLQMPSKKSIMQESEGILFF